MRRTPKPASLSPLLAREGDGSTHDQKERPAPALPAGAAGAAATNEKTIVFAPGPVGLQLEPVNEDPFYGCRIVRFIDGGPNNPGQARKSGKIKPGDLVIKVEAEGSWMGATTYDEIVNLLKISNVRRILTIQSVWSEETASKMARTMQDFIPTQKIRPGSDGRTTRYTPGTILPPPLLGTPQHRQHEEVIDFTSRISPATDMDWIHSPSDMVLLSHSVDVSRHIAGNRRLPKEDGGPIIVSLSFTEQQGTDDDQFCSSDDDEQSNEGPVTPQSNGGDGRSNGGHSRSSSFDSQQTAKSSNRSVLMATPRQSLADQFLLLDGYTGPLIPDSPYVTSRSATNDTASNESARRNDLSAHGNSGLSTANTLSKAASKLLPTESDGTHDPVMILQADYDERLSMTQIEHSKTEKELKDLYVQTCARNDATIQGLEVANKLVQKRMNDDAQAHVRSLEAAEKRIAEADEGLRKAQREIKVKADAIKEQSIRMMKMEQERQMEIAALEDENQRLREESSSRAMEIDMARTMVSEMEGRILALETEKDNVTARLEDAFYANQALEESVNLKGNEVALQRKELQDVEANLTDSRSQAEDYRKKHASAIAQLERLAKEMNDAETARSLDLHQNKDQASVLEMNLKATTGLLQEREKQNQELMTKLKEFELFKHETSSLTETLAKSVQEKNKAINHNQTVTSKLRTENESLRKQLTDMAGDVEALLHEKLAMEATLAEAWKDVEVAKKEASKMHESLLEKLENGELNANESIQEKELAIDGLTREIECLKEKSNDDTLKGQMLLVLLHLVRRVTEQEQGKLEASLAIACRDRERLFVEVEILQETLTNDETQIEALKRDAVASQSMVENLQRQVDASAAETEKREREQRTHLELLSTELQAKETALSASENRLHDVENELKQVSDIHKALQSSYDSLIDERDESKRTFLAGTEKLQQELMVLSTQLCATQSHLLQAKGDYDRVVASRSDMQEIIDSSLSENERLRQRNSADLERTSLILLRKDMELATLSARSTNLADDLALVLFKVEQLRQKVECSSIEHITSRASVVSENRSLASNLESCQAELSSKSTRVLEVEGEIVSLMKIIDELERETATTKNQSEVLARSHDRDIKSVSILVKSKDDELKNMSTRLQTMNETNESMKLALEAACHELQAALEETTNTEERYKNEIDLMVSDAAGRAAAFLSLQSQIKDLEDESDGFQRREYSLQKRVDYLLAQNKEAACRYSVHMKEVAGNLEAKSGKLHQALTELGHMKDEFEKLKFSEEQLCHKQELMALEVEASDRCTQQLTMALAARLESKTDALSIMQRRFHDTNNDIDAAKFNEEQLLYKLESWVLWKEVNQIEQRKKLEMLSIAMRNEQNILEETQSELLTTKEAYFIPEDEFQSEFETLTRMAKVTEALHRREVDSLTSQLESRTHGLAVATSQKRDLEVKLDCVVLENDSLHQNVKTLTMESQLAEARHRQEVQLLKIELDTRRNELDVAASQLEEIESAGAGIKATSDLRNTLQSLVLDSKKTQETLEAELRVKIDEVLLKEERLREFEDEILVFKESQEGTATENTRLTSLIDDLKAVIATQTTILQSNECQRMALDEENERLSSVMKALESSLSLSRNENLGIQNELASVVLEKSEAESDVADLKMELNMQRTRLSLLVSSKDEALIKSESLVSELSRSLLQANGVVASLQAQLKDREYHADEKSRKDVRLLQDTVKSLESALKCKEEEIVEKSERIDVFSSTVANLRFELMERNEAHNYLHSKIEDSTKQLEHLKHELEMESEAELQRMHDKATLELSEIRTVVDNQSDRIFELEAILFEAERCAEDAYRSLSLAQQSEEEQREKFYLWQQCLRNEVVKLKKVHHEQLVDSERTATNLTSELEDRVKSLEFDLGSVTEEIKSLFGLKSTIENDLERAIEERAAAKTMLDQRSAEVDRLLATVAAFSAKVDEDENAMKTQASEIETLRVSVSAMRSDYEHHVEFLQKRVLSLSAAFIQKHLRKRRLQETLDIEKADLLKHISDLSARLLSMEEQQIKIETEHLSVENSLKRAILKFRAEYVSKYLECGRLQRRQAILLEERGRAESEIAELKKSIVAFNLDRAETEKKLLVGISASECEMGNLRNQVDQLSEELQIGKEEYILLVANSRNEVKELTLRVRNLEAEKEIAQPIIRFERELALKCLSLRESQLIKLQQKTVSIEIELMDERLKVLELLSAQKAETEKSAALVVTCCQLEAQVNTLMGEVSAKDAIVAKLEGLKDQERQTSNEALETRQNQIEDFRLQLSAASSRLEACGEEVTKLVSMREDDSEKIQTLQIENNRMALVIGKLEKSKHSLEVKVTELENDSNKIGLTLSSSEAQSQQFEQKIACLEDDRLREREQLKKLVSMRESVGMKLNDELEKSERFQLRVRDLEREKVDLTHKICMVNVELQSERSQRQELVFGKKSLEEKYEALEKRCEEQARIVQALEEGEAVKNEAISRLNCEVTIVQERNLRLVAELESKTDEGVSLKARIAELSTKSFGLEEHKAILEATVAALQKDIGNLMDNSLRQTDIEVTKSNHDFAKTISTLQADNERIRSDLSVATSEVKAMGERIVAKEDRIVFLADENDNLRRGMEQLKVDLSHAVRILEAKSKGQEEKVEYLEIDLARKSSELLEKTQDLCQLESTYESVCDELTNIKRTSHESNARLQDYELVVEELGNLKMQGKEKEKHIIELEDMIEGFRIASIENEASLSRINQEMQLMEEQLIERENYIAHLECPVDFCRVQGQEMDDERAHVMKDYSQLSRDQEASAESDHLASVKSAFHQQKAFIQDLKLSESVLTNFMQEVMGVANQAEKEILELSGRLTAVEDIYLSPSNLLASLDLAGLGSSKGYVDDVRARLEDMASLAYTTSRELKVREREFLKWQANRIREPPIPITPPSKPTKLLKVDASKATNMDRDDVMYRGIAGARLLCCILDKRSKAELASAFRKWSCCVGAMKASSSHKETAVALAQQLEITREKLIILKSHLKGKKSNGKPRLRRILERLDNSSNRSNREGEMGFLAGNNESFEL